MTFNQFILLL